MKFTRFVLIVAVTILAFVGGTGRSEENETSVFTSRSGNFRVEVNGADAVVVSTKDSSQKLNVPQDADALNPDDEFYFSPNDEWIYAGRHGGSCLRDGDLYHRSEPGKIDAFENFNEFAWKNSAKLKMLKEDYANAGECAMTLFVTWSVDSRRLLIGLLGGEDKRKMQSAYLYFNTAKKEF